MARYLWYAELMLAIGVAVVSGDAGHACEMLEDAIRYLEDHADAELLSVERNG